MEIFYLPIFWVDSLILEFFSDFSNILNQSKNTNSIITVKKALNDTHNFNKVVKTPSKNNIRHNYKSGGIPENIFNCGWINEVWSGEDGNPPIGSYLFLVDQSYNGLLLSDLLRFIRNFKGHEYEDKNKCINLTDQQAADQKLKIIREKIRTGWVKYFNEKFPELLLTVYSVAVSNIGNLRKDSQRENFIKKYYLKEASKLSVLPNSLSAFAKEFISRTGKTIRNTLEANETWLYSLQVNRALIQFVKYPREPIIIKEDEIVKLKLEESPDGATNQKLKVTVLRKLAEVRSSIEMHLCSCRDFVATKIDTLHNKQVISETVLTARYSNNEKIPSTEIASYILSENILSSIIELQNFEGQFIVFTNRTYKEVSSIATSLINNSKGNIIQFQLSFKNLSPSYKNDLMKKKITLQLGSNKTIMLEKVYEMNDAKDDLPVKGSELLNLIHNETIELLPSELPISSFYVKRVLQIISSPPNEIEPDYIRETKFTNELLFQNQDNSKKVFFLRDIAGSGKTAYIQHIATRVIKAKKPTNCIVIYKKAFEILQQLEKLQHVNEVQELVKLLWPSSYLQQDVAFCLLKNHILLLVIDQVHLLRKIQRNNFVSFISAMLKLEIRLSVLIAERDVDGREIRDYDHVDNVKKRCFQLRPFDRDGKVEFYDNRFKNVVCSKPWLPSIDILYENCINITQGFGKHAHTPFTCQMVLKYFQDHCNSRFDIPSMLSSKDIHDYFIEFLLSSHLSQLNITGIIEKDCEYFNLIKHSVLWPCANNALSKLNQSKGEGNFDLSELVDNMRWYMGYAKDFSDSHEHLNEGSFNDYFIAWLINKCLDPAVGEIYYKQIGSFLCNDILIIHENTFKYDGILQLLNCKIDAQKVVEALKQMEQKPDTICDIVFLTLNKNYEKLFNGLVESVTMASISQTYNLGFDYKEQYTRIFHNSLMQNNMAAINFFMNVVNIEVNTRVGPQLDTALHCVIKYSPLADEKIDLIKSIIQNGGNVGIKNFQGKSVFETAIEKEDISEDILKTLISYEYNNFEFQKNWESWKTKIDGDKFPNLEIFYENQIEAFKYLHGLKEGPLALFPTWDMVP